MELCNLYSDFSPNDFLVYMPTTEENEKRSARSPLPKLPAIKDGLNKKKKSTKSKKSKNQMKNNRLSRFVSVEEPRTHPVNFVWHNKISLNDYRNETRRAEAEAEAVANLVRLESLKCVEVRRPESPKPEKDFILQNKLSVKTASIEKRRQEEEQRKKEEEEKKREEERRKESRDGKKKTTKAKTKKPHAAPSEPQEPANEEEIRCAHLTQALQSEMDTAERRKPRKKRPKRKRDSLLLNKCDSSSSVATLVSDFNHGRFDNEGGGGAAAVKASASDEFMEVWNRGEQKMAERRRKVQAIKRKKANLQRLSNATSAAAAAVRRKKKSGATAEVEDPSVRTLNINNGNSSIATHDLATSASDAASTITTAPNGEFFSAIATILSIVKGQESRRSVRRLVAGVVDALEARDTNHRARVLVSHGGTKDFLDALVYTGRENPYDIQHLVKLHRILMLMAPRDARFAVKARCSGAMDVTLAMLKNFVTCMQVLPTLLRVLRFYLKNKGNASRVGKSGGIMCMLRIIKHCGKRHQLVQKLALNALTCMCQPTNQEAFFLGVAGISDLLKAYVMWFTNDTGMREKTIAIREGILEVLLEMLKNKTGRKMFVDSRGPEVLHRIAIEHLDNPRLERVIARSLDVIRRSMLSETVPVPGHNGPFLFGLPDTVVDESSSDSAGSDDDDDDAKGQVDCAATPLPSSSSKMDKGEIAARFSRFFPEEALIPAARRRTGTFTTTVHSLTTHDSVADGAEADAVYVEYAGPPKTVMPVSKTAHPFWGKTAASWRGAEPLRYTSTTSRLERMLEALKEKFEVAAIGFSDSMDGRSKIIYDEDAKVAQMKCKDSSIANLFRPPEWNGGGAWRRKVEVKGGGGNGGGGGGGGNGSNIAGNNDHFDAAEKSSCSRHAVVGNDGENGRVTSVTGVTRGVRTCEGNDERGGDEETWKASMMDGFVEEQEANFMTNTNSDEGKIGKSHGHSLKFDSRFESGNLRRAIQVGERDYNLILRNDINTNHHHQWFYFEVSNITDLAPYRFNIVNMQKRLSQFSYGMQPVMYSVEEAMVGRPCWRRVGDNVTYFRNTYFKGRKRRQDKFYFTLSFEIAFPFVGDVCYIAFHFPYTHSAMMRWIKETEKSIDSTTVFYRRQSLCKTLGGNEVPLLTITANVDNKNAAAVANLDKRPYVLLSARVHPGETNSSWIMQGCMKKLMENSDEARALREKFIFKIIPMLNPDGVINGCHRTSLTGEDLNRRWLAPSAELHPTIFHAKGLFQYLHHVARKRVKLFCDLHGHSLFKNIFLYGCSENQTWEGKGRKKEAVDYRQLPLILHETAPAFSLRNSSFMVQKDRASTARVVIWKQFNVEMSYTLESTYSGMDRGPYGGLQLSTRHMEEMGEKLVASLRLLDGAAIMSKFSTRSKTGFFKHSKLWMDREANAGEDELTRHSKFMEGLKTFKGELERELRGEDVSDDEAKDATGSDDESEEEEDDNDDQSGTDSDVGQSQDSDD